MNSSGSREDTRADFKTPLCSRTDRLEAWAVRNSGWLALVMIAAVLAVRLAYAASCYLNPDEVQHFNAARPHTWLEAYRASTDLAHPPLFILVLHAILYFGNTEFILRIPSIASGTVALWLAFAWIRHSFGAIEALASLLFLSVSPAAISASTEVRQYGLLLCFVCGALYATERTLRDNSVPWAFLQALCLLAALLTHYTATVPILCIDLYLLLCCFLRRVPSRLLLTILAGQCVLAAALAGLYLAHIRHSGVFTSQGLSYLRQYYYVSTHETFFSFSKRACIGTFSYMADKRWAMLAMLIYAAGISALLANRGGTSRLMAFLVASPVAVGFVAALCQVFPFTGSRHQAYLLPFLAAGLAAGFAWIPRRWAVPLLLLGICIAPFWIIRTAADNNPQNQSISDMTTAIDYIHSNVPRSAAIFVDYETRLELEHYLAQDRAHPKGGHVLPDGSETVDEYRLIPPANYVWSFNPTTVLALANQRASELAIPRNGPLWLVSVAWLNPPLAPRLPMEQMRSNRVFGVISVIEVVRN